MATIKSFTDLQQSKELAEILPLESADMCYRVLPGIKEGMPVQYTSIVPDDAFFESDIPAWSLSALLELMPIGCSIDKENIEYVASYVFPHKVYEYSGNNPIDACYEMILKLNELNLL